MEARTDEPVRTRPQPPRIFTVGHSNQTVEHFLRLLQQHEVDVVVDIRSQPYSRFAPQFNRESLKHDIRNAGIQYMFLGDELGGRILGRIATLEERIARTEQVWQLPLFRSGVDR